MHLSDQELLNYNQVGLIPGPQETEEKFYKRATYCLHLKNHITNMLSHELPFSFEDIHSTDGIMKKGCEKAEQLYDISPNWVPLFFSNYKLSFWQGGCAWIFQHQLNTPTSAFFQLRQQFRNSKNIWEFTIAMS